ncbi:TonB-dependent receptor [Thalassotalea sp. 1_MG-2023]|uniref:TonB-dependent receptor plug domain-containing protein n=1 Tax=Thalassotalea sp. 1_MG-2023 TaxID=3062680 RepID=UPI0026E1E81A|nr:TonB-dependent receptor [Thalassotalea sp. 1_MG-2023]MDO6426009.1 TonB-dependent receptor [Thalassotalea sp. 1_MG-2023]
MKKIPLVKCTLALAIASACSTANAASTDNQEAKQKAEKIVVTGSRIARTNLVAAGAVTVIDKSAIDASPYQNIGDILQTMTVSQPSENSLSANGGGTVRFDLRGIGARRTLILLNGKRLPAGGKGADSSADLGAIPTAIIERVEILMDGASAIYGSDAIGGVVNIITRKDFEGFEISATYGDNFDGDGSKTTVELVGGVSGDKGNVTFSASYSEDKAIYSDQIPFSNEVVQLQNDGSVTPWGSFWVPWTAVTDPDGNRLTRGSDYGDFHQFTDADRYNHHEQSFLQQPTEKYTMSALGNYEFGNILASKDVMFDFEVLYSHRNNDSNSAAQPLIPWIGGYDDIPISKDNYYNQQFGPKDSNGNAYDIFKWSKRMNEFGPRQSRFSSNQFHIALGLSGDFNEDWDWRAGYTFGRYETQETREGVFNWARVREAVGPTHFNSEGELRCGTGPEEVKFLESTCVPLNVFLTPGESQDPRAMAYVSGDWSNVSYGHSSIKTATFDVTGSLFETDAGIIGVATGASYMELDGRIQTDSNAVHATTTDGNGRPTSGGYNVSEAYVEINIPLLSGMKFAQSLEVNLASRYSNYSTNAGATTNSKASIFWAVNDDISLRSTISQAFRAANIRELFAGQLPSFADGIDPCKTLGDNEPLRPLTPENDAGCLKTGAPSSGFRDGLEQIRTNTGGNPHLDPETAKIKTFGIVYTPTWLDGFSISADYYDIKLEDTISTFNAQRKIELCNETGDFCDDIHRYQSGPLQGVLLGVDTYNENLNASHYQGLDSEVHYRLNTQEYGDFTFGLTWHHAIKHEISIFDGGVTDYVGTHTANGGFQPENKVNLMVNWNFDDWSMNWTTYIIGELTTDGRPENDITPEYTLDAWTYSNINVTYQQSDNLGYSVGITNVFNEDPRRTMLTQGNTNSTGAYSPAFLGSTFFLSTKYSF